MHSTYYIYTAMYTRAHTYACYISNYSNYIKRIISGCIKIIKLIQFN